MEKSRRKLWLLYSKNVESGTLPPISDLVLPQKAASGRRHFVSTGQNQSVDVKSLLITFWNNTYESEDRPKEFEMDNQSTSDEEKIFDLGMELLKAVKKGQRGKIKELLEAGVPVNFQHPRTKSTALHIAAAGSNLVAAEMLMENKNLNYLLRDRLNRLALDNAMFFSIFPEMAELIAPKTKEQALGEGVNLKAEFQANLRKWFQQDWYNLLAQDDIYTPPEPD